MSFSQYLRIPTVVELSSKEKDGAIEELAAALCKSIRIRKSRPIIDDILKREESASTFIGQGIAIPHSRDTIAKGFAIAVGRSLQGVPFDAARGALAHIIVLVLAGKRDADAAQMVSLMAEIASCFKSTMVREVLFSSTAGVDMASLASSFDGAVTPSASSADNRKTTDPVLGVAVTLAREVKAGAIMVFADAVRENEFLDRLPGRTRRIVVTSNKTRFAPDDKRISAVIAAPSFLSDRVSQVKIGLLLALSRGLLRREDMVVCISGNSRAGVFDTVMAIDVDREYEFFFTASHAILPPDVKPEVLERVVGIAGEIAVEGREGKPLGTIFVLGDTNSVNVYVRQLIINPFRGYSEAERNIMDPGLDETLKEFAAIDGAFVVTGDGIVLSAGSYLKPDAEIATLPSGLGARHAAAAAITACTNSLAIAVSESTRTVTIFKNGSIMMSLSRPASQQTSTGPKILS